MATSIFKGAFTIAGAQNWKNGYHRWKDHPWLSTFYRIHSILIQGISDCWILRNPLKAPANDGSFRLHWSALNRRHWNRMVHGPKFRTKTARALQDDSPVPIPLPSMPSPSCMCTIKWNFGYCFVCYWIVFHPSVLQKKVYRKIFGGSTFSWRNLGENFTVATYHSKMESSLKGRIIALHILAPAIIHPCKNVTYR